MRSGHRVFRSQVEDALTYKSASQEGRRSQCANVKTGDRVDQITIHQGVNAAVMSSLCTLKRIALKKVDLL